MNRKTKFILRCILSAALLFSCVMLCRSIIDTVSRITSSAQARELGSSPTAPAEAPPSVTVLPAESQDITVPQEEATVWVPAPVSDDKDAEKLSTTNFAALKETNPDVCAWIFAPGTDINYPVVQGSDNKYYLTHNWGRGNTAHGSIFIECSNAPDFTDFNTIVYGHNLLLGGMFSDLHKYNNLDFIQKLPYIYIAAEGQVYRYEVFSVYDAELDDMCYRISFPDGDSRADFLINAEQNCKIDIGITPEITDRILTLSTCSTAGNNKRWVVLARLPMIPAEQIG